jgi:CubicO group peptidase (beta-lactamase class C family)
MNSKPSAAPVPSAPRLAAAAFALLMAPSALSPARAAPFPTAAPESVGLSSERLERLDAAMQDDVDSKRKTGIVVLVARRGKIAHLKAFGMADPKTGAPMRTDSEFRLYSSTKPIISVALLMLYEEGKFELTDPVEKYIPEFASLKIYAGVGADGRPILEAPKRKPTMQDVFRHTAGFPGTVLQLWNGPVEKIWMGAKLGPDLDTEIHTIAGLPMLYQPGEDWRYGPEHDVQAYLIEKLSGLPVDEFLRRRIFAPLGMTHTYYRPPADDLARYTALSGPDGTGGLKVVDPAAGGQYLKDAQYPRGSTGLSSTAEDELRFGQMLLNGGELDGVRILSRKTVEMMLTDQLPSDVKSIGFGPDLKFAGARYGLGIGIMTDVAASGRLGSPGTADWPGAGTTDMYIDRKEQMITIAFTQYMPSDMNWLYRVQTLTYQAIAD